MRAHPHDQSALGPDQDWQAVLNGQPIPERRRQRDCWVPVRARLVWERDGVEHIDTMAWAWTRDPDLVLVGVGDRRARIRGVWLVPADVERLPVDDR